MRKQMITISIIAAMTVLVVGCGKSSSSKKGALEATEGIVQNVGHSINESIDQSGGVSAEGNSSVSIGVSEGVGEEVSDMIPNQSKSSSSSSKDGKNIGSSMSFDADSFGTINGINFSLDGNNFEETFGKDGFELENTSDSVGIACTNPKYKDLTLIVYGKTIDHISPKDVKEKGFSGYYIGGQTDKKPKMNWKGLTWGATEKEIKEKLGKPDEETDSGISKTLVYNMNSDGTIQMYYTVYNNKDKLVEYPGLQDVRFRVFEAEDFLTEVEK